MHELTPKQDTHKNLPGPFNVQDRRPVIEYLVCEDPSLSAAAEAMLADVRIDDSMLDAQSNPLLKAEMGRKKIPVRHQASSVHIQVRHV